MTTHMIHHQAARVSAPRLAAYLGIETRRSWDDLDTRPDYLIRYGSGRRVPYRPRHRTFNRRRMLTRYTNRLEELQRLRAAGVRVPEFSTTGAPTTRPTSLILRELGQGRQTTRGRGITYLSQDEALDLGQLPESDLYIRFIPKDRQFRVHVFGVATRVRELIPGDPEAQEQPIWNLDHGFTYRIPDEPPPAQVKPTAVQAVSALGLDFGAVDVMTLDRMAWVLEVNTAPGLADPTLEWYATQISQSTGLTGVPGWDADNLERTDAT